jgi:hypothetical protein
MILSFVFSAWVIVFTIYFIIFYLFEKKTKNRSLIDFLFFNNNKKKISNDYDNEYYEMVDKH